ncbi:MAG: hypothetical protein WKF64_08435 [Ilumatobacteraceae bacterium]
MTNDEARAIASRIVNTWNGGPNFGEWVTRLVKIDRHDAVAVFDHLSETLDYPPTIARFLTDCRQRHTVDHHPPADCHQCNGTGYVDGPPLTQIVVGQPHVYTTMKPCDCRNPTRRPRRLDDAALFADR